MHIGLFFGSFNPVHIGHLIIANYMVEFTSMDAVWFVLSPQNPFKKKHTLLDDSFRYDLLELALENYEHCQVSDVELHMPKPSYTSDTLAYLSDRFPSNNFSLIMGSDGLPTFHKWKNFKTIIEHYKRFVYPRHGSEAIDFSLHPNIELVSAPKIEISSSFIRHALKEGKDIRFFLPLKVYDTILSKGFYL